MVKYLLKQHNIVFYDGDCGFCNALVQWLIPRDSNNVFKFAPLHSPLGNIVKQQLHLPPDYTDSLIVWDAARQKGYIRSKAVSNIAGYLPKYKWVYYILKCTPSFIADVFYNFIATRRKRILKNNEYCNLQMKSQYQDRFLA